ncbi:MAG: hypothetical protein ABIL09_20015 [Gemmatimonadota bacterium]
MKRRLEKRRPKQYGRTPAQVYAYEFDTQGFVQGMKDLWNDLWGDGIGGTASAGPVTVNGRIESPVHVSATDDSLYISVSAMGASVGVAIALPAGPLGGSPATPVPNYSQQRPLP